MYKYTNTPQEVFKKNAPIKNRLLHTDVIGELKS